MKSGANLSRALRATNNLDLEELDVIEECIALIRHNPQYASVVAKDIFAIPWNEFLALSGEERLMIDWLSYHLAAPTTNLEPVLQTLYKLRPEELAMVEKQIANKKSKLKASLQIKTLLDDENYLITFDEYLALSDQEGEELKLGAYEKYRDWIDRELAKRRARWMIICGGKIIQWSPTLDDYPSGEKLVTLGKQLGYALWVFIANPLIEGDWLSIRMQNRTKILAGVS